MPPSAAVHPGNRVALLTLARVEGFMTRRALAAIAAALIITATPAPAAAQAGYFGQNKVQSRHLKFRVMKTTHFDIYYYPEEEAAARMASRIAERWYLRLSTVFTHQLRNRQPLVLYGSGSQFRQTNVVE